MSSWAEDKFDVSRLTDEEEQPGEWHCHACADAGLTPWPPGTECPNYPCKAFQPAKCTACPQCGWVL